MAKPTQEIKKTSPLKKYLGLVVAIALLVVIFIGITLYELRVASHKQTENDRIQVLQTLGQYSREIIRDIFDANASYGEDTNSPHMRAVLNRLQQNTQEFPKILQALENGGTYISPNGVTYHVSNDNVQSISNNLHALKQNWEPLAANIKAYLAVADDIMVDSQDELESAMTQAKVSNLNLITETDNAISTIQGHIAKEEILEQRILYGAIGFGIVYFIFMIFVFVRNLLKADEQAAVARREVDEIMSSVQEGLFLVDDNLVIGSQHSQALNAILPSMDVADQPFEEVLDKILSKSDIENTKSYINQLFKPRVKESLVKSLNPLNRVQVFIDDKKGGLSDKYLRFDFTRVYEDKEIKQILVSVADITQEVELEQRLEKEREQNNRQVEMLVKVLRVEPSILAGYLRRGNQVAEKINNILRQQNNRVGLREKINEIFREIHSFKGESSALEFDRFVSIAEEMEGKLKELREQRDLVGDDFLSIAVYLDALMDQLEITKNLHERLQVHAHQPSASAKSAHNVEEGLKSAMHDVVAQVNHGDVDQYLAHYIEQAAERNYKLVEHHVEGFNKAPFDEIRMDLIKSIAVQLVRNAIVHGIETPEARRAKGKERQGNIGVSLIHRDGFYDLIVEDDGKGIDAEAIREKLRQIPDFNKNPDEMSEDELYRAIFITGLSTAQTSTEDAGRGVGMDVVLDRVRSLGAKIAIRSKPNQFTRFTIRLSA